MSKRKAQKTNAKGGWQGSGANVTKRKKLDWVEVAHKFARQLEEKRRAAFYKQSEDAAAQRSGKAAVMRAMKWLERILKRHPEMWQAVEASPDPARFVVFLHHSLKAKK